MNKKPAINPTPTTRHRSTMTALRIRRSVRVTRWVNGQRLDGVGSAIERHYSIGKGLLAVGILFLLASLILR